MAYLSNLARATGLVSPATQHRTDSAAISTTVSSHKRRLDSESMSPTKRTKRWLEASTAVEDTVIHKVKSSKITKRSRDKKEKRRSFWGLPLLANFFGKKQGPAIDNLEGDTIWDDDTPMASTEAGNDFTLMADGDDYDEDVLVEKTQRTLQDYHSDRNLDYNDPRFKEWTYEENWFFTRLRNRGREPLFDHTWALDFPTYPDSLFTKDPNKVFINSINATIFRAVRAFDNVSRAGGHVHAQIAGGAVPEKPLFRAITDYYKWTLLDGNLENKAHIPVTAIACAKPRESTESVVGRVTDQLHALGRQYRDKWRHPDCKESDAQQIYTHSLPTLFGFVIKYTVVAIVTCDSSVPGSPIRTLHTADWKVIGQNVWHAIALAIAFVRQRNYLMQLDAEGELGPEIIKDQNDPDK